MDQIFNELNIAFTEDFSVKTYVLGILICAVLLYALSLVYVRYGRAISNRSQLAKTLILVGITTFIIISIVKSSLALSLGLVGALSIVRFRTAIKEPEELAYFFMAISIGLGMGANQLLPTLIGFTVLVLVIFLLSKNTLKDSFSQNMLLSMTCTPEEKSGLTDQISKIIIENSQRTDLKRLSFSDEGLNFNFHIEISSLDKVNVINQKLLDVKENMNITFIDSGV
jgi:uncharacterized membrane protein YhiD involved in acid resistance